MAIEVDNESNKVTIHGVEKIQLGPVVEILRDDGDPMPFPEPFKRTIEINTGEFGKSILIDLYGFDKDGLYIKI